MCQSSKESPSEFLSRLYEAADLANICEDKFIFARFRAGLCLQIKTFCKEMSALTFQDWIKHANAWWNAHSVKAIHLVDNPFSVDRESVSGYFQSEKGKNLVQTKANGEKTVVSKGVTFGQNPTLASEAYANPLSPTIANITARMEALELNSLIPTTGKEGQVGTKNVVRDKLVKSSIADNKLKSFIKSVVQEANNEKVQTRKQYRNNYRNHDGYYPSENYVPDDNFDDNADRYPNYHSRNKTQRGTQQFNDRYSPMEGGNQRYNGQSYGNQRYDGHAQGNQRHDGYSYGSQRRGSYNQPPPRRNYYGNSYNQGGQNYGNNYGESRNPREPTNGYQNFGHGHYNDNDNGYYNRSYGNVENRQKSNNSYGPQSNYNDLDAPMNARKNFNAKPKN